MRSLRKPSCQGAGRRADRRSFGRCARELAIVRPLSRGIGWYTSIGSANEELLECLHAETGARYWKFSYPTQFSDRYGYNNGPRASPVIDGDRVYAIGAEGKLHCLKLETGQLIWKRDIAAEFKVPQDFFGVASTPLIEGDSLIVNVGAPGGPCVAAFDKGTGKMLWGAGDLWGASYASPVPAVATWEEAPARVRRGREPAANRRLAEH